MCFGAYSDSHFQRASQSWPGLETNVSVGCLGFVREKVVTHQASRPSRPGWLTLSADPIVLLARPQWTVPCRIPSSENEGASEKAVLSPLDLDSRFSKEE